MSEPPARPPSPARRLLLDRKFHLYLANFGVGKGIAFAGPIVLGVTLGPRLYSAVEFGLAFAGVAAMIAMAGLPQAVMQIVLMRQGRKIDDLLLTSTAAVAFAALLAALIFWRLGVDAKYLIAAAVLALCAAQQSGVAYARAHALPNLNVWIDHAPTIVVVLVAGGLALGGAGDDVARGGAILAAIAAAVFCGACVAAWRRRAPDLGARWIEAVSIGLPLVASSLVGVWIIASGRVAMGTLLADADVYAYAFTFRVASILLLIHAVVATGFAARLYKMPTRRFDAIAVGLVAAIGALTLLFILAAPQTLALHWAGGDKADLLDARPAVALVPAQIFFWIGGAIAESRIARARAAWFATKAGLCVALCALFTALVWRGSGHIDFQTLTGILLAQQIAHCGAIHLALLRRRVPLRRTAAVTFGVGAIVAGAGLAMAVG